MAAVLAVVQFRPVLADQLPAAGGDDWNDGSVAP